MKCIVALTLVLALTACGTTPSNPSAQGPTPHLATQAAGDVTVQPSAATRTEANASATDGQQAALLGNGNTATFTMPSTLATGRYTVKVRAYGSYYQVWPIVAFKQGTSTLASATIDSSMYVERTLGTFDLKAGDVRVIEFTNDLYGGSASSDRNVYVDALILTPVSSGTPANAVEPSATLNGATFTSDASATQGQAVSLPANDHTARFTVPISGHYTLKVVARGNNYYGWPLLLVRSGSTTLAQVMIDTSSYAARTAGVFDLTAGQTLDVTFTNDAYGGSAATDRNAVVDYLLLEPVPLSGTNVKDFGARGDAQTDDAAALNRAADSGQNLYFPAGTYVISSPMLFNGKSNVTVEGNGATLKASSTFTNSQGVLVLSNTSDVTVKNLTVVGRADQPSASDGVLVVRTNGSTSGTRNTLTNLTVRDVPTMGIRIDGATSTTVSGSKVSGMKMHGIWTYKANSTVLLNNIIDGVGLSAPASSPGLGILATVGDTILVEANRISQVNNTATKTEGYSNATFRNNIVNGFAKDGIKIMEHTPDGVSGVTNGVIEGNTIQGYTGYNPEASSNIEFQSVLGGRISGNTVYGNPNFVGNAQDEQDGIRVNAGAGGISSADIVVENNKVYDFSNMGLHSHSPRLIVRNNAFESSTGFWGVYLGPASDNASITGNTIKSNQIGVHFDNDAAGANISSNNFSIGLNTNNGTGIYASNTGNNNNTITNNIFNATRYPIRLSGTGNTCSGNTGTYTSGC